MAPGIEDRAVAAIVGAVVGDAAARPTHWVYDPAKKEEIITKHKTVEFVPENYCPFYNIPTGESSCYGDQVYALTKSLVDSKGWNKEDYKKQLYTVFGPGTDYDVDKKLGRPATKEDQPISAHWAHHSIKHFLTQYKDKSEETGHDDNMADGLAKVAPLVALYAGDANLLKHVEEMVEVTQKNEVAVKYALAAARILEKYVLNGPDKNAISEVMEASPDDVKEALKVAVAAKGDDHKQTVLKLGPSCSNPGNFQNMVQCLVKADGTYEGSIRCTLSATGDNCGRGTFVGSCLGAQVGFKGLPQDWIKKTTLAPKIKILAEELVKLRK